MMKMRSSFAALFAMVASGFMMVGIARAAGMPQLNFTCPTGIDVHADEGGYVYINGSAS
jgi:hypothetical protein